MALAKKKLVKKVVKKVVKKKAVAKKVAGKKKVLKKKAPVKTLKIKGNKSSIPKGDTKAGKGKYAYEPYRAKKNIGNCAKNALLRGKDTQGAIADVMEAFPDCNISTASIGYYRTALRKEGYDY